MCPVTVSFEHDGIHGGKAAGRTCWSVSLGNKDAEHLVEQYIKCAECPFFELVKKEEGEAAFRG